MARKKRMSYSEFLQHLRRTRNRASWCLRSLWGPGKNICTRGNACPITKVCRELTGRRYSGSDFYAAAQAINLDQRVVVTIASAADNTAMTRRRRQVRRDLLRVLGLKETDR